MNRSIISDLNAFLGYEERLAVAKLLEGLSQDRRFLDEIVRLDIDMLVMSDGTALDSPSRDAPRFLRIGEQTGESLLGYLNAKSPKWGAESQVMRESQRLRNSLALNWNLVVTDMIETIAVKGMLLLDDLSHVATFESELDRQHVNSIVLSSRAAVEKKLGLSYLHIRAEDATDDVLTFLAGQQ